MPKKKDEEITVPMSKWVDRERLLSICRKYHADLEREGYTDRGGDIERMVAKIEKKEAL